MLSKTGRKRVVSCVVVEGGDAAGERDGMLERGARGQAEPEVLGPSRHCAHQWQRVVDGYLYATLQGGVRRGAVEVVKSEDIGEEDAVETAGLQQSGEVRPVTQVVVAVGAVIRVAPQSGRLVDHAAHVEGVEADVSPGHAETSAGAGSVAEGMASSRKPVT